MKADEMRKLIGGEREKIPRGPSGSPQNELRLAFQDYRAHQLKTDPGGAAAEAFRQAVAHVRKSHPGFSPRLTDPDYFGWGGHDASDGAE